MSLFSTLIREKEILTGIVYMKITERGIERKRKRREKKEEEERKRGGKGEKKRRRKEEEGGTHLLELNIERLVQRRLEHLNHFLRDKARVSVCVCVCVCVRKKERKKEREKEKKGGREKRNLTNRRKGETRLQ